VEQIGRYRVVRTLGTGGMGQVFLAEDPVLERQVALKLLHRDPTSVSLHEEAKALAALRHPGIVTVFEIGEHDGRDFIAMEYVPGKTLRELMIAGVTPRDELIAICAKVAAAVAAAHEAGILHRDIKPENILVDSAGDVKVLDFGIARRLRHPEPPRRSATASELLASLTTTLPVALGADTEVSAGTQTVFGTPAYMSLEVMRGEASTEASDVYSLGVVLFECLAGKRPYRGSTLIEMIAQLVDGAIEPLDDPLAELVLAMLSRRPEQRPSLADVVVRLMAPDSPPRVAPRPRPTPWIVAGLILVAAGVVVWKLRTPTGAPSLAQVDAGAPTPHGLIKLAVAPFDFKVAAYGGEQPNPDSLAEILANLLEDVSPGPLRAFSLGGIDRDQLVPRALGVEAQYLVTAEIDDRGDRARARVVLIDTTSKDRIELEPVNGDATSLAHMLDHMVDRIAERLAPGDRLPRERDHGRAVKFYKRGKEFLDASRFGVARSYLEQAVDADPSFVDAWQSYALCLGWLEAPDALLQHATARARDLAPPGASHELMRGIALFLEGRFSEARDALLPLDKPGDKASRELLYFLGEASWHDGRHDEAYALFERSLRAYPEFHPAGLHMSQYAIARRKIDLAHYIVGMTGEQVDLTELAAGHYEKLAGNHGVATEAALLILGRDVPATLEARHHGIDAGAYKIARALEAGHPDAARAELDALWKAEIEGHTFEGFAFSQLESLGEILIAGGLADEARRLVERLAVESRAHPQRGYHRIAILTAMLTGDASLIPAQRLTYREAKLAEAATAELAGDRVRAADALAAIVADPTFYFDFPERALLLRDLVALHRKRAALALCNDTLRPPTFRYAYLPIRPRCVAIGARAPTHD